MTADQRERLARVALSSLFEPASPLVTGIVAQFGPVAVCERLRADPELDGLRFDELRDQDGTIRPHWRSFTKTLTGLSAEEFAKRRASAGAMVRDNGVTYNVYDETAGQTRPWQLDIVPFILSAADWRNIEAAVVQSRLV